MRLRLGKFQLNSGKLCLPVVLVFLLFLMFCNLLTPSPAEAEPSESLRIIGEGVMTPVEVTMAELEAMEQYQHVYSAINTYPTKQWYIARGVKLRDLLALAGMKKEATLVRFYSRDGYDVTFTVQELLIDKRYYFPGLKENHPSDGSIPGSPEGAEEVEPLLALASAEGSTDPQTMNDKDTLLLVLGQRAVTEQTSTLFVKNINMIEILTTNPDKWDAPRVNVPVGSNLPPGTKLILSNKNSDVDKIYYTTDGSTPTVNSPIFNWSASRWWPVRGDLEEFNSPIELTEDMVYESKNGQKYIVIKAKTIGPGKEDSDVVTFTFTLDPEATDPNLEPGAPPAGVFLDQSRIDLPVGGTFRLEAIVEPYNALDKRVTWSSSDTRVATVDTRGLVTVVSHGTAVITVKTVEGDYTATCVVNGPVGEGKGSTKVPQEPPEVTADMPEANLGAVGVPEGDAASAGVDEEPEEEEEVHTAATPVPEGRGQYLMLRDAPKAITPEGGDKQPASSQVQVFELSLAEPLPLPEARRVLELYTAMVFLFFLLSGAAKRYIEFAKES
ncbi:MAG: Ig-like domain-containing protein [bacterium]